MALIRGTNSHCPCPVCLVPSNKLYDLTSTYPNRTPEDVNACVQLWKKDRRAGEEALKEQSLRPVEVGTHYHVFFKVNNSDPYQTISQDPLHAYHIGLWGKHLFGELKRHVKALGRHAEKKIDDQWVCSTNTIIIVLV